MKMAAMRSQRGTAALEFGIVLVLLVALGLGLFEFGILAYDKQVITNASREGARAAIVQRPDLTETEKQDLIDGIVRDYYTGRLITFGEYDEPTISYPLGGVGDRAFQQDLSVRVTFNYNSLAASLIGLGTQMTLAGETLMKMERLISP
jgi:Flp pilus assembly protein TadG